MNKILFGNNISTNEAYSYENPIKSVKEKRKLFHEIVNGNKEAFTNSNTTAHLPSKYINSSRYNKLSNEEIANSLLKMNEVSKNGYIYTFDLETIGMPKIMNLSDPDDIRNIHHANSTITEFALRRVKVENGRAVDGTSELITSFTSSRENYTDYIDFITSKNGIKSPNSISALNRFAGYAESEWVGEKRNSKIVKFKNNANILSVPNIRDGASTLSERANLIVGDSNYNSYMESIFNVLKDISESENSIITGMNIHGFDIDFLSEMLKQAMPDRVESIDELFTNLKEKEFDTQAVADRVISERVYEDQNKYKKKLLDKADLLEKESKINEASELRKQASAIENDLTLKNSIIGAQERGMSGGLGEAHTAAPDTKATEEFTLAYMDDFNQVANKIKEEFKTSTFNSSDGKLFKASGGSYIASPDDVFFSMENGNLNDYNPTLLEKGHGYTISEKAIDINKLNLSKEDKAKFKGNRFLEIKDIDPSIDRTSYIAYSDVNKLQDILNTNNIDVLENTLENRDSIIKEMELSKLDKLRVKRENFGKVNSNDGYRAFNNYYGTYLDYLEDVKDLGIENNKETFKKALIDGVMTAPDGSDVNSLEFSRRIRNPKTSDLITENTKTMLGLYDDFNSNAETYNIINSTVRNAIGDASVSKDVMNEGTRRTATSTYRRALDTISNNLYSNTKDEEILNFVTKSDTLINKEYERLKSIPKGNESAISITKGNNFDINDIKVSESELKRRAFFNVTGEAFSKDSEIAKDIAFGYKRINMPSQRAEAIDILNGAMEYGGISINSKEKISQAIERNVLRVNSDTKDKILTRKQRNSYLNSLASDLADRGLISTEEFKSFRELSNGKIKAKTNFLANSIFQNKQKYTGIIEKATGKTYAEAVSKGLVGYGSMSQEELQFVKSYNRNMHMTSNFAPGSTLSFLGKSFDENMKAIGLDKSTKGLNRLGVGNVFSFGNGRKEINDSIIDILTDKDGLNWEEKHAKSFIKNVLKNKNNDGFSYASGYLKEQSSKNGLAYNLFSKDNKTYMVASSRDKEKYIFDMIVGNSSLDEIGSKAVLMELPKRETINGVNVIKRGEVYKAITNDIAAVSSDDNTIAFKTVDTIDQLIENMSGQIKYSKKELEHGNIKGATSKLKKSWVNINEAKALTGTSFYAEEVNGKINMVKKTFLNDSDQMLKSLVNQKELVKALPIILNEDTIGAEALRKSFTDSVDGSIDIFTNRILNGSVEFSNMGTKEKLWYMKNIDTIAKEIAQNKHISLSDKMEEIIEGMAKTGVHGFMGKDSGEVVKGFYNLVPQTSMSAGSNYGNITRPLINQLMSADVVSESSMSTLGRHNLYGNLGSRITNGEDIFSLLKLKRGQAYVGMNEADELGEGLFKGISIRRKQITSQEFLQMKEAALSDKGIRRISQEILDTGVKVDENEVKEALKSIFNTSGLYEDQGLAKTAIGTIFSNKGIKQYQFGEGFNKKLGDKIKTGDVLYYEKGRPVKFDGRAGKIVGFSDNKIAVEMFGNYKSFKAGFGFEKAEMTVPTFKGKRQAEVIDTVFEHLFKADVLHNPNIQKHGAYTTVVSPYMNILTDSIKNKNDADRLNELFKKHMSGNLHEAFYNDKLRRWQIKEVSHITDSASYNSPQRFLNVINELSSDGSDFGKSVKSKVSNFENTKTFYSDMRLLKDNTIENTGVSISSRGLSVMGDYSLNGDSMEDYLKLMKFSDGEMASKWKPIKDSLENMIMNDPKNVKLKLQASNIAQTSALMLGKDSLNGYSLDAFKDSLKEVDLKEITNYSGVVSVDDLTDIFKYTKDGPRGYVVDLSKHGIEFDNFIYRDLSKTMTDKELQALGIESKVKKIIVPAIDPNFAGENFTLSSIQKQYADFFSNINEFLDGKSDKALYGSNYNIIKSISMGYENIGNALAEELTNKNGILKMSTKTKALHSSSTKMMKISAPVLRDGRYIDDMFKDASTFIDKNGKVSYRQIAYRNINDMMGGSIEDNGKNYVDFALSILKDNTDNSDEFFNMLKGYDIAKNAKNIQEAKRIVKEGFDEESLKLLSKNYLETVGILDVVLRDPTFKGESFQVVRTFASDYVHEGSSMLDAVTAFKLNADTDGDEVRFISMALFGDKKIGLRSENSDIVMTMKDIQESMVDDNLRTLKALETKHFDMEEMKKKGFHRLEQYILETSEQYGTDYVPRASTGINLDTELIARISKGEIGQISATNHNIKAAKDAFVKGIDDINEANRVRSIIEEFTKVTEQSLIDTKSIKKLSDASDMINRINVYRTSFDRMAQGASNGSDQYVKNNLVRLANSLTMFVENGTFEAGGLDLSSGNIDEINNMVERIMSRNIVTGENTTKYSLEEVMLVLKDILESEKGGDAFFSSATRQSVTKFNKYGEERTTTDKIADIVSDKNMDIIKSDYKDTAIGAAFDDKSINSYINLKNISGEYDSLKKGGVLVNTDEANGVFRFIGTEEKNKNVIAKLENINTGEKISYRGNSYDDLGKTLEEKGFTRFGKFEDSYDTLEELKKSDGFVKLSTNIDDITKAKRYDKMTTDIDYLIKSMSDTSEITKEVIGNIDVETQKDALLTVNALVEKGMIEREDASSMIKSFNDKIKAKGTKEYRRMKEEVILENSKLAKKYSLSGSNIGSFIDNELNTKAINESYRISNINKVSKELGNIKRIDVDSVIKELGFKNEEFNNYLRSGLNAENRELGFKFGRGVKKSGFLGDELFQSKFLKWDLKGAKELIESNKVEQAIGILNQAVIPFGEYAGYTVGNLNNETLHKVLNELSNIGGIDDSVKNSISGIINTALESEKSGITREVTNIGLRASKDDSILSDMMDSMIKKTYEKAEKRKAKRAMNNKAASENMKNVAKNIKNSSKSGKRTSKSILENLSEVIEKSKKDSKIMIGAAVGLGALALGAYAYGRDVEPKNTAKISTQNSGDIKTDENTGSNSSYTNVPMTDSRFYATQSTGINVNVNGSYANGKDANQFSNELANMFKGRDLNVNTHFRDSRKQVNEKEIEDIMYRATI